MNPGDTPFDPYTETAQQPVVDRSVVEHSSADTDQPPSGDRPRTPLPLKPYVPTY